MTTIATLKKSESNMRPIKKVVPIKVHSPKTRLRLEDAKNNFEKVNTTSVQYSFMPPQLAKQYTSSKSNKIGNQNSLFEEIVNRNKICLMKDIMTTNSECIENKAVVRCIGEDSQNNLNKSRGVLKIVGSKKSQIPEDPVHIRCPTSDALDNLEKGRGLRMSRVLQHSTDFHDDVPVTRVRDSEAMDNYRKNKIGSVGILMDSTKQTQMKSTIEPRCPTEEAKKTWQMSQGGGMSQVMGRHSNGEQINSTVSSKKRVLDKDGNEINPQNSSGIGGVMTRDQSYRELGRQPRVRLDGEEIAVKNQGQISSILNNSTTIQQESCIPRVRPEGQESFDAARGIATKNLIMKYGNLPNEPRPKSHINRYSIKIAKQSRGGAMKDALCPPRQKHSKRRPKSAYQ